MARPRGISLAVHLIKGILICDRKILAPAGLRATGQAIMTNCGADNQPEISCKRPGAQMNQYHRSFIIQYHRSCYNHVYEYHRVSEYTLQTWLFHQNKKQQIYNSSYLPIKVP